MDYASALLKGRSGSPSPASTSSAPAPKPIARPAPAPIERPKQAAATPTKTGPTTDPVEAAGIFGRVPVNVAVKIASFSGPQGVANLGVSSRYLFDKVLASAWKNVQEQGPKTKKASIKIRLDVAGTAADIEEEGDDAIEVKGDGKILSLPLSQFQRDAQRNKLIAYWLDVVTHVQNERNNAAKKADASKDPLAATKKGDLKVTLGGGFTIDASGKNQRSKQKHLYDSSSIADVHQWLDAAVALLQGSFEQKLHLENGVIVLKRVGRVGALVSVQNGSEHGLFDLADFVLSLRSAAKDFLPFVGRCIVALKNGVKSFQQEADAELYIERERTIASVLKHQSLDRSLKSLKHLLEVGAVPNSNLPQLFAKKRAEKMRSQSQAFIEYDNIWEFVTSNLPGDYEKAKEEAVRLNEQAEKDRESARARVEEARAKAIEERKAKELSKQQTKNSDKSGEDAEEKKGAPKDKKVEVKRVDKDGWVSREVRTVKSDGSAAEEEAPAPQQPQQGKKGENKGAKPKPNQAGKQSPAQSSKAKAATEEASKEFLDGNRYAAALREGSYQSQSDV